MADRNADNADLLVDDLKRKARRRLVGAVVLALAAAIILPMLLEKEPRPLGDDVSVQIPPVDEGKFINRLTGKAGDGKPLPKADDKADPKAARAAVESKSAGTPESPTVADAPATKGAAPAVPSQPAAVPAEAPPGGKSLAEAEKRVLTPAQKSVPASDARTASVSKTATKPVPPDATAPTKAAEGEAKAATKAAATETKSEPKSVATNMKGQPGPASETRAATPTSVAEATPEPKAEPKAAPAAVASSAPPAAASAKADGFVVQLAAFADDKGANALANKLKRVGYAAYVEPVQTSRGTLWRVRVGGFASRPEADSARAKLKDEGYSGMVAPAK